MTARKHAPPPKQGWMSRVAERVPWRVKTLSLSALLFAITGVIGTFATQDALKLYDGFAYHHTLISSEPFTVKGLILAPLSFSFGVLFLLAKQAQPGDFEKISKRAFRWMGRYLLLVAVSIVVALFSSIPQYLVVDQLAQARGYVPCPTPRWPRHQNDRWALPGPHGPTERCPGEGTDADL